MNERKWTKGPWKVVPASNDDEGFPLFYDVMHTGYYTGTVAGCYNSRQLRDGISRDESLANAHLIAAAPDLYEALDGLLKAEWMMSHDWGGDRDAVIFVAEAALAKARGEA